jgi:hypothetical protein
MARENDWDREGERDRDRDRRFQDRGSQRTTETSSHAGWGGQGFSQGSFGSFGSQGERLYNEYGGQGFGAEHGYGGQSGGGMGSYMGSRSQGRFGSQGGYGQGSEGWDRDRGFSQGGYNQGNESYGRGYYGPRDEEYRNRNRENWGAGEHNFAAREGGWGGYGQYDRERGGQFYPGPSNYRSEGQGYGQGYYGQQSYGQQSFGRHSGKGPRGYQRSDERIREDISEQLTVNPDIDATNIEVEVNNGDVTLKGTVDERRAKRLAEDVTERVSGVKQVHNQIRVESNQEHGGVISSGHSGTTTGTQTTSTQSSSGQKAGELTGAKK